jgi:hypothetical protein
MRLTAVNSRGFPLIAQLPPISMASSSVTLQLLTPVPAVWNPPPRPTNTTALGHASELIYSCVTAGSATWPRPAHASPHTLCIVDNWTPTFRYWLCRKLWLVKFLKTTLSTHVYVLWETGRLNWSVDPKIHYVSLWLSEVISRGFKGNCMNAWSFCVGYMSLFASDVRKWVGGSILQCDEVKQ